MSDLKTTPPRKTIPSRIEQEAARMQAFHMPRYDRLPEIELYMDQLVNYVNRTLAPLASQDSDEEILLTKSMVNNYVKQRVIQPPEKKKYGKTQLAYLLMLCPLKQVFSIPECVQLIRIAGGVSLRESYDAFCTELEKALCRSFGAGSPASFEPDVQTRMTQAVADKIYLQKLLAAKGRSFGK